MKLHIIGAPRCGATAYARSLSDANRVPFINEPFKFGYYEKNGSNGIDTTGGALLNTVLDTTTQYVCHHITSQYVGRYSTPPDDHEFIVIWRRDRWRQMLSYCIMMTLKERYNFHNTDYNTESIHVDILYAQRMIDEWIILEQFRKLHRHQYFCYEDIVIDSAVYRRNTGYENITIENLHEIRKVYDHYWRWR